MINRCRICVYIRHTHKIKRTYKFIKGVDLIYLRQLQEIVKMKTYAIALMVIACCVAVIAALIILRRLCNSGRKKKETTQNPVSIAPRETTRRRLLWQFLRLNELMLMWKRERENPKAVAQRMVEWLLWEDKLLVGLTWVAVEVVEELDCQLFVMFHVIIIYCVDLKK